MRQGVEAMTALNRRASLAMVKAGILSATDVTGFGLIGHLQEMAKASGVAARLWVSRIPVLPHVLEMIERGVLNPGIAMNQSSFGRFVQGSFCTPEPATEADKARLNLLYESENSGGLLIAAAPESSAALLRAGIGAVEIGEIIAGTAGVISIEP